jgi:hypothetical protein
MKPSVNNLPVRTHLDILPGAVEPLQILKSDKMTSIFKMTLKLVIS